MTVPVYAVAGTFTITVSYVSDRFVNARAFLIMMGSAISITGYAMILGSYNHHVQYGGLFLVTMGAYTCIIGVCPPLYCRRPAC